MFTVLLYTHNSLRPSQWATTISYLHAAVNAARIEGAAQPEVIVLANAPLPIPPGWRLDTEHIGQRGLLDCWDKIHRGATMARHQTVFTVEHDVLYPACYFSDAPAPDATAWLYNRKVMCLDERGYFLSARYGGRLVTSTMIADRQALIDASSRRVRFLLDGGRLQWDELGRMNTSNGYPINEAPMKTWESREPVIDVRLDGTLTGRRDAYDKRYLDRVPGWPSAEFVLREIAGG